MTRHPVAALSTALALSLLATLVYGAQPPAATVADETLTGSWSTGVPDVAVFKGIPFAGLQQLPGGSSRR